MKGSFFDLLLTDYELGAGMDGMTLLDQVKDVAPRTELILMSGKLSGREVMLKDARFVAKPISQVSLDLALTR
jgi:DNA-binding NtrC family response regulator